MSTRRRCTAALASFAVLVGTVLILFLPAAEAAYPGRSGRLAFGIQIGTGQPDIYSVRPDGQGLKQLTSNDEFDACAAYSPDGKLLAWCGQRGASTHIWVMKHDGRHERQVTDLCGRALWPDFSPTGQQLAMNYQTLPGCPPSTAPVNEDIYVIDLDGSGLRALTSDPARDRYPVWSPDGSRIAFISNRDSSKPTGIGIDQVWIMNADGSGQRQLTFDPIPKGQLPEWRPDGRKLAYTTSQPATATQPAAGDIFVMDADGTDIVQLTRGPEVEFGLTWSPDCTRMAFVDNVDRTVYVMQTDGSDRRVVHAVGQQFAVAWQPLAVKGRSHCTSASVTELASFVEGPCFDDVCGSGSTVGPDGALYVTDSTRGRIQRIDPWRGSVTTYADGLPRQIRGVVGGGVGDIAFLDRTPYVLVAGVSEFWTELIGSPNAPAAEGVYRLDRVGSGTTRATLIADISTWSEDNPPANSEFFVPGGFTYAMQPFRGGFLVTDGHHNRVLRVRLNGAIDVFHDFAANVVPTGLEHVGRTVLVGQAGPVPHTPETGRVVALQRAGGQAVPLAGGAPLLVDVEVGPRQRLYGLAQGDWPYEGQEGKEGFPAAPNTGSLMLADRHGKFRSVVSGLDRPTTFELIGETAFVVTITGKVLRISGLGR